MDGLSLQGRAVGAVPEGAAERKDGETLPGANTLLYPNLRAIPTVIGPLRQGLAGTGLLDT